MLNGNAKRLKDGLEVFESESSVLGSFRLDGWGVGSWGLRWELREGGLYFVTVIVITSLAIPPLPSLTRTVIGTGPSADGAVHVVCFDEAAAALPDGAVHA